MKAILLAFLLDFWWLGVPAQPTVLLQGFMIDLASNQLPNSALEKKYFCSSLLQQQGATSSKVRAAADNSLTLLKNQLSEQQINLAEVKFIPFDLLPNKEFELIGDTQQVYAAQYRGNVLCYFLLKEDKIDSFLLLNQGGRAYFLSFCE